MRDLPPGFQRFEDMGQARMPSTRRLFDYWRAGIADGRQMRRTDVDPSAIKPILPFLLLGNIEQSPFRVRFRLVGLAVLPLWRGDDPAGSFIAIEAYDDFDRYVIPELNPVNRRP
ncbi:MAG: PAS domain-containing protein [Rhodospirillaceae bacterium]|nr:PAS domain-containing protein [Rhodospirillaceae bacterium]